MVLDNGADPKICKSGSEWKCEYIRRCCPRSSPASSLMLAFARRSSVEPPNFNTEDLMP